MGQSSKKVKFSLILLIFLMILGIFGVYFSRVLLTNSLGKKHIGISYMTMNNDFYTILSAEIEQKIHEKGDIVYTRDAALDVERQKEQIRLFIDQSVDAIIINPVDSDDKHLLSLLMEAREKGILVIAIDSQLKNDSIANTTVLSDNYQAGVLNARKMMDTVDHAKILLLEHKQARSSQDRMAGFIDTIKDHDAYQIIDRKEALGQTEIAMPVVKQVIEDGTDFDVVVSLNDQVSLGALAAIKEKKLSKKVYIFSIDGSPEVKTLIANTNDIETTVAQSLTRMSQDCVTALYRILDGKAVDKKMIVPVTLMDHNNVQDYDLTRWQ